MRSEKVPLELQNAFRRRPELRQRVTDAINQFPTLYDLLNDLIQYVAESEGDAARSDTVVPITKKRKLDGTDGQDGSEQAISRSNAWTRGSPYLSATEISFSVPQRKKLKLEMVRRDKGGGGIRAVNDATGTPEFGFAWDDIDYVFCIPVPEKATRQHNYVVISKQATDALPTPQAAGGTEQIVWTVPESAPKTVTLGAVEGESETYVSSISRAVEAELARLKKSVIVPTKEEFASSIEESHRKGEKAWHVKAFRGTKDGYLYFLSPGILWAFKKPLVFYSFENITSISYTSVLQRTFNLNITTADGQETEYSMLDQANFAGIDAYVKRHGLNDASMAEERRAKRLNINGTGNAKAENGTEGAPGEDGENDETELERAQRMLEDEEDEMEEDYDPGSEGDSGGSGTDSDEDEDGDAEGDQDEESEGRDLIAEELGSEAEDVEVEEE